MVNIVRVEASKDAFNDRKWEGYVVVRLAAITHSRTYTPSVGKYIKNYLKEHYPNSSKKLSVRRFRQQSSIYDFEIYFQDEAEEAEFIMTIKNLEGSSI